MFPDVTSGTVPMVVDDGSHVTVSMMESTEAWTSAGTDGVLEEDYIGGRKGGGRTGCVSDDETGGGGSWAVGDWRQ